VTGERPRARSPIRNSALILRGNRNRRHTFSLVRLVPQLDSVSLGFSIPCGGHYRVHPPLAPIASDRLQHVFEVAALHLLERREFFKGRGRCVRRVSALCQFSGLYSLRRSDERVLPFAHPWLARFVVAPAIRQSMP